MHNDELRDVVDELNDRGYDASFMVASLHDAERHEMDPTDADPSFLGLSGPDWADMGTEGSGPTPKDWISDSAGYVEEHELPHHEKDWADEPDGDIIKFNDGRSKPQQGPRSSARYAHHRLPALRAGCRRGGGGPGHGDVQPRQPPRGGLGRGARQADPRPAAAGPAVSWVGVDAATGAGDQARRSRPGQPTAHRPGVPSARPPALCRRSPGGLRL